MIVVANTSPLTNLTAIGQIDLLCRLYGQLHIAQGVWEELNAEGQRWPGCDEVAAANWIERHYDGENAPLRAELGGDVDEALVAARKAEQ